MGCYSSETGAIHLIQVRDDSSGLDQREDAMKVARFWTHFEDRADVLTDGMRVLEKEKALRMTPRFLAWATGRVCDSPGSSHSLINRN